MAAVCCESAWRLTHVSEILRIKSWEFVHGGSLVNVDTDEANAVMTDDVAVRSMEDETWIEQRRWGGGGQGGKCVVYSMGCLV